jgi:hypothetical protein
MTMKAEILLENSTGISIAVYFGDGHPVWNRGFVHKVLDVEAGQFADAYFDYPKLSSCTVAQYKEQKQRGDIMGMLAQDLDRMIKPETLLTYRLVVWVAAHVVGERVYMALEEKNED